MLTVALIVPSRRRAQAIAKARRLPVWDGVREIRGTHLDPVTMRPAGPGEVRVEWPFRPEAT